MGIGVRWIGIPLEELVPINGLSGGGEKGGGGPGQLVIVGEVIAVGRDGLVAAVFAVFGDGVRKEVPAFDGSLYVGVGEGLKVRHPAESG